MGKLLTRCCRQAVAKAIKNRVEGMLCGHSNEKRVAADIYDAEDARQRDDDAKRTTGQSSLSLFLMGLPMCQSPEKFLFLSHPEKCNGSLKKSATAMSCTLLEKCNRTFLRKKCN
jgi:hypothetical protein